MSTEKIYKVVTYIASQHVHELNDGAVHLDIGAGGGDLIKHLRKELKINSMACDFHVERFGLEGVPIEKVDLNKEGLPYDESTFDLITCSEVIEHLENYRSLVREIHRVLKPGGIVILTTPNVLNMKSRIKYLGTGFFNLFGPLPIKNDKLYSTGGHITPIPYFYLVHALADNDFMDIVLNIDKKQRSSSFLAFLLSPFLIIGYLFFIRNEYLKFKTITEENKDFATKQFSIDILTGRTIVVSAKK